MSKRALAALAALCLPGLLAAAPLAQPKVNPASNEPNLTAILESWKLDVTRDLRNPVLEGVEPACRFVRMNKGKVTFTPIVALGLETTTRGGWYPVDLRRIPSVAGRAREASVVVWNYTFKQPKAEMDSLKFTAPKVEGPSAFDPGDKPFGVFVRNDQFSDGGVYVDRREVAATNKRLQNQPYKALVYPAVDAKTGEPIADSYLICWEYSDNDDFQDVITRIDNVRLLPPEKLPGITAGPPKARKLVAGFQFTEGPAWDPNGSGLYFSDIPAAHIVRYTKDKTEVANGASRESNGLMFDKNGDLIACEHAGRQVSRARPGQTGQTVIDRYKGKRLNSPNDLWIDVEGGIYFTDPRYGKRDDLEQDKEAVYYVDKTGQITRIIEDLVRPNGIALSPDGKSLYVVDNGAGTLWQYVVQGPGKIGQGKRIAYTPHPDGMSVDQDGRLYVTGREGVLVLKADGTWIGTIECEEQPANCTFGGEGWKTLFITARTGLYAIETTTRGWHVQLDGVKK